LGDGHGHGHRLAPSSEGQAGELGPDPALPVVMVAVTVGVSEAATRQRVARGWICAVGAGLGRAAGSRAHLNRACQPWDFCGCILMTIQCVRVNTSNTSESLLHLEMYVMHFNHTQHVVP
jgi:hypothetical protein